MIKVLYVQYQRDVGTIESTRCGKLTWGLYSCKSYFTVSSVTLKYHVDQR